MRNLTVYISLILTTMFFMASCKRVIPEDKLAHIYADMYMVDQWVSGNHNVTSRRADTTFVYGELFASYGVSAEDYRRSMQVYLRTPESYAKILQSSKEILQAKLTALIQKDSLATIADSILSARKAIWDEGGYPIYYENKYVGFYPTDTICQGPDSAKYLIDFPVLDTMYKGPVMIIREDEEDSSKVSVHSDLDTTAVERLRRDGGRRNNLRNRQMRRPE